MAWNRKLSKLLQRLFFPIVFSRDSGYNGLNQTVKRIFKENKENFKKTVEQLNKDYNFFDWTYLQWNTIIFATDSAAKPFIDSRPRIRSQTFSLPENEIKSNDLDLKESKIRKILNLKQRNNFKLHIRP